MDDFTRKFSLAMEKDEEIHQILSTVYQALEEKGYNPINQIVGYILSEDPHLLHQSQQCPHPDPQDRSGRAAAGAGPQVSGTVTSSNKNMACFLWEDAERIYCTFPIFLFL